VLIFDECHNLEGLCEDAASVQMSTGLLEEAYKEVETLQRMVVDPSFDIQARIDLRSLKLRVNSCSDPCCDS